MRKTIIERMCVISEKMRSGDDRKVMSMDNRAKAQTDIRALSRELGLTADQVVILTAIIQNSSGNKVDGENLASTLGLEYLRFLTYSKELDGLRKKGYIRLNKDGAIVIPRETMNSLQDDRPVVPDPVDGLDALGVLARIGKILSAREKDLCGTFDALEEIEHMLVRSPDNSVSRTLCRYAGSLTSLDRMLLVVLVYKYYHDDNDIITWYEIEDDFTGDEIDTLKGLVKCEICNLQTKGIIEFTSEDGLISKDYFHIKDAVKGEILKDVGGVRIRDKKVGASRRITAASIAPKELFYNPDEGRQVIQLSDLMKRERFDVIRARMKEMGMRTGFTCLFYGPPGTGKTETVYQIARESGRDMFVVDVSQIKSCWVGESEKNIKSVFTKYRDCVLSGGEIPILLLNEADAVFGIRSEGAGSAVDKMENAIQNIILQQMEDLDGILIATTNLTCNLDRAFERRFLYKVRFDKPSAGARGSIWRSLIPGLPEDEALRLATDYDFSGGQIENIARKRAIRELISGTVPSYEEVRGYCDEENIDDAVSHRRIGF